MIMILVHFVVLLPLLPETKGRFDFFLMTVRAVYLIADRANGVAIQVDQVIMKWWP